MFHFFTAVQMYLLSMKKLFLLNVSFLSATSHTRATQLSISSRNKKRNIFDGRVQFVTEQKAVSSFLLSVCWQSRVVNIKVIQMSETIDINLYYTSVPMGMCIPLIQT